MGPSHSVEQVLDQYGSALFRLGYFMLGSSADTEDAVQDTLIRYLQKHPQFADNEHEKSLAAAGDDQPMPGSAALARTASTG